MKTIFPVQGGFVSRVTAPSIEAKGAFSTRELDDGLFNRRRES